GMDSVFGLHHAAHAHNAEVGGDSLGGVDVRTIKADTADGASR
ncbi:enoyl-CoA hydratase, partial [Streptomyces phaeoluteigriseus]